MIVRVPREEAKLRGDSLGSVAERSASPVEALAARVHALAGEHDQARSRYAKAWMLGDAIARAEDRRSYFEQLTEGPWFGLKR
jgi:hypothetical protein